MGAGVPAGCRVSGGAGSARARPAALPPSTRGRGLPRSADSLAQLGPPRWPSGRKRMSGGGGRGACDTLPPPPPLPPPSRRVVVRWRKDGGGHRVSGGSGTQRPARAVSAAAASSRPVPGPAVSLPGWEATGAPGFPVSPHPPGWRESSWGPRSPAQEGPAASPGAQCSPATPGYPGVPAAPLGRQACRPPGDPSCALPPPPPRPQLPPFFPNWRPAPFCQQAGLRITPGSPHSLSGARGLPPFPWCSPLPAPLPGSLCPLPVSLCLPQQQTGLQIPSPPAALEFPLGSPVFPGTSH